MRGTGVLATIGATAPFVGLFGTVWGIMNSFIGISKSQTTNLAVVAPGIAEALLATALGLVGRHSGRGDLQRVRALDRAAIARCSATPPREVLRLVSRDLDRPVAAPAPAVGAPADAAAGGRVRVSHERSSRSRRGRRSREVHEINVTPFIDVMLVLLIIFMVAAPLATVDIAVNLPASSAQPQPRPDKPIYLSIKVRSHARARQ